MFSEVVGRHGVDKSGVVIYRMGGFCARGKMYWRVIWVTFLGGKLMMGWDTINVASCMSGFGLQREVLMKHVFERTIVHDILCTGETRACFLLLWL